MSDYDVMKPSRAYSCVFLNDVMGEFIQPEVRLLVNSEVGIACSLTIKLFFLCRKQKRKVCELFVSNLWTAMMINRLRPSSSYFSDDNRDASLIQNASRMASPIVLQ